MFLVESFCIDDYQVFAQGLDKVAFLEYVIWLLVVRSTKRCICSYVLVTYNSYSSYGLFRPSKLFSLFVKGFS